MSHRTIFFLSSLEFPIFWVRIFEAISLLGSSVCVQLHPFPSPTNWEKNPEYKSLSLNISLAFSSSLWPCVNPVLTLAHVGSWPIAGKHWPKSKMLVGLPLRGDLTALCGCGAALQRMLSAANHEIFCFIHIREFVPWSLRNKAHTAQKWGTV